MKQIVMRLLFFALLISCTGIVQGQYPFYFSTANFNPPDSWQQDSAVRMGTVANTNIQITTARFTASCYFRFYSALSGGVNYQSAADTDIQIALSTPFALQSTGSVAQAKSFYFTPENLTDNYVFKTDGMGAPGNARCAVIRVQGPIQSITSISQTPAGNVYSGQDGVIGAGLSDTLSPGQGVYLRYTTNFWDTSVVVEMTGTGTHYQAVIPASVNATGVNLNYYAFTSGSGLTILHSDADLMTINLYNNNFANFHYAVQCPYTLGDAFFQWTETDKARYYPGDSVRFTSVFNDTIASATLKVTYWHLTDSITSTVYNINNSENFTWSWQPPDTDSRGYFAQLYLLQGENAVDSASIAIDVSSDWKRFPRYGFLSAYPQTDSVYRNYVFSALNRCHLNGIQFYDVNHKHNMPLAGTIGNPDSVWNDIANRPTYLSTVLGYINLAHQHNMKAMNYNLIYGAYANSLVADGVLPQWGLYTDANHQNQDEYTLPATWASNLAVENPADTGWQNYFITQESDLFQAIPFDGWHVDQLGNQGTVYNYYGQQVDLTTGFGSFLPLIKSRLNVNLVMNAVTNYAQPQIAACPVDFLYTEVWPPYTGYGDLVALIDTNSTLSHGNLSTVLAAYLDQNISDTLGTFNTNAVLFTDAVIFAAGGGHIELGDHLLSNPYFPNNNLNMTCDLQQELIKYYDFATGYENLLRDSIGPSAITLSASGSVSLSASAAAGKVWYLSRQKNNMQIFHFINLVTANTLNWNDPNDNQTVPTIQQNMPLSFSTLKPIGKIYFISPDWNNGLPTSIPFSVSGTSVTFTLPWLTYWSTIVVDYAEPASSLNSVTYANTITAYPNPAGAEVNFEIQTGNAAQLTLTITDILGNVVTQKLNQQLNAGEQVLNLPFAGKNAGVYFWRADFTNEQGYEQNQSGKLVHF